MHAGRLITQGPAAEIRRQQETEARIETDQPDQAARVMRELGLREVRTTAHGAVGRLGDVAPEKIVTACVHAGLSVTRFVVDAPTLEDVFVRLTGEGFDVSG
jgi:ABC-2 type transport system ATP-binding protein